jgi:hypothetical protein
VTPLIRSPRRRVVIEPGGAAFSERIVCCVPRWRGVAAQHRRSAV